jgi:putative pyruvate formate lyase activating enzyme
VNRFQSVGFCGAKAELKINLAQLLFGEEPPISGTRGSGTIFFSHCNLLCVYCQNHLISLNGHGNTITEEELVAIMLELQRQGAHNINLVTPSHFSPQLAHAIRSAKHKALIIPIVWNSSAYEKTSTLQEMEGLVDIYLPDYKYYHKIYARKYSNAEDYPQVALAALREMHRQCGDLVVNSDGIASRGLMVRMLVLPHGLAGVKQSLHLLADEFGTRLALSLMGQYYPAGKANEYPELGRGILPEEYQEVLDTAIALGFEQVYIQQLSSDDHWTPRFIRGGDAANSNALQGENL